MHYNDIPSLVGEETRKRVMDYAASKAEGGMKFAELGVFIGGTLFRLACKLKERNILADVYAIDNWEYANISSESYKWSGTENKGHGFDRVLNARKEFELEDMVHIVRNDTTKAAANFEDNSLSYLFLDASHGYGGVRLELESWLPKMKERCLIAIHDYCEFGIRNAVTDVCGPCQEIIDDGATGIIKDTL